MSHNNPSDLHTLGCVYAELGKTKQAREVLVEAMDKMDLTEPDPNYWYAFGRIAEQDGEPDSALADYARVTKPDRALESRIPHIIWRNSVLRSRQLQNDGSRIIGNAMFRR